MSITIQKLFEVTVQGSRPIEPLPAGRWAAARGLWAAEFTGQSLKAFVPKNDCQFDMIWISQNPGTWNNPNHPELYTNNTFDWLAWNAHYQEGQDIPHWRNIRKAIARIVAGKPIRILFTNSYFFEWPNGRYSTEEVAEWFASRHVNLFSSLTERHAITNDTLVCLCGQYAQKSWPRLNGNLPAFAKTPYKLGHPAHGHLARSLRLLFPP